MDKYLITVTLLNSFLYYQGEYGKRDDFISLLRKDKFEPDDAMALGIAFEDDIQRYTETWIEKVIDVKKYMTKNEIQSYETTNVLTDKFMTKLSTVMDMIREIGNKVEGGFWQQSLSKNISVMGRNFVIYGRADVILDDTIYDIKYTGKYDLGKFKKSMQHRIEFACTDYEKFEYLVSDLKRCYVETYWKSKDDLDVVKKTIADMLFYFEQDKEANELFLRNWKSKY